MTLICLFGERCTLLTPICNSRRDCALFGRDAEMCGVQGAIGAAVGGCEGLGLARTKANRSKRFS